MIAPAELTIDIAGLSLGAQVWGDDHAPPLLALHGWLDNAGSYALLAPLLAAPYRVIALELPGHGHSGHLPAGMSYHFVDYVRFVLAAADALELDQFDLLGHSLGAGIAALLAAAAPHRIRHLLLIEGLGPIGDDGTHTLQRFRDGILPAANNKGLRVFGRLEQAIAARAIAGGLRAELARPIVERGVLEVADGWSWRSDSRLTRTTPVRLAEAQIHAILAGIRAPTSMLLAHPATSYLPTEMMMARAACVEHIDVQHLDGGHHLHMEHPEAVATWATHALATPLRA